jgi:hypothetical protein
MLLRELSTEQNESQPDSQDGLAVTAGTARFSSRIAILSNVARSLALSARAMASVWRERQQIAHAMTRPQLAAMTALRILSDLPKMTVNTMRLTMTTTMMAVDMMM